jgi:hypothetical protein
MPRRFWVGVAFALAAGGLGAAVGPGCFGPDRPACAFSCIDPPHTCPAGYVCGDDSLCRDPTSTALCRLEVADAGAERGGDGGGDGGGDDAP